MIALATLHAMATAPLHAQTDLLRSGINTKILSEALDPGDMKVVLENIVQAAVFGDLRHESKLYPNAAALLEGLDAGEIDVFALTTLDYLRNQHKDLEPRVVLSKDGSTTVNYVLLANASKSADKTIKDFRGGSVKIIDTGLSEFLELWTDVVLAREGLEVTRSFFGSIEYVERPNMAAMPVFFGKEDLCLIEDEHWEILSELNPAMKTRLRVIAKSPDVIQGALLLRKSMEKGIQERAVKSLLELHKSPNGAQILKFGKIERIVPFKHQDLVPVMELYNEYQELFGPAALDPAPTEDAVTGPAPLGDAITNTESGEPE